MIPKNLKTILIIFIFFILIITSMFKWFLDLTFSEWIAFTALAFNVLAFSAVFYNLYAVFTQFRKSMAKPRIKVAFNEKGEQQGILDYINKHAWDLPRLWLINEGNAISRYFQIDFMIPENIGKPSAGHLIRNDGIYILSYVNDGKHTLFVNRPYSDPSMVFADAFDFCKCLEVYKDSFEIAYKIYGDWAETQEGKLKIVINKKQEVS